MGVGFRYMRLTPCRLVTAATCGKISPKGRPAGTLAAKSAKNLPARSPLVTARNRADSPTTSRVNAVWAGTVSDEPEVRLTDPSSKLTRRLPSRTYIVPVHGDRCRGALG